MTFLIFNFQNPINEFQTTNFKPQISNKTQQTKTQNFKQLAIWNL